MAQFHKIKGMKIYEVVIAQLREKLVSGELGPGEMLPPEKNLAEQMGVSRASVREALKILEFTGFLESKPSEGTKVAYFHPDLLMERLNIATLSHTTTPFQDLVELRETLEPKIARLAVERGDDAELEAIAQIVARTRESSDEILNSESDALFHLALARASHNIFFVRTLESALSMLEELRTRNLRNNRRREAIQAEHAVIVERLLARDAVGAGKAMKRHLLNVRRSVELGLSAPMIDIDETDQAG